MAKRTTKRPSRNAWAEMTDLAERVVESERKLLHRLIEAVTPRPASPAPKSRTSKAAAHTRRTPRKKVTRRTAKRAA
jgi:hypothetical protein